MNSLSLTKVQAARALSVGIAVLIAVVAYMLVLGPRLSEASDLRSETTQVEDANEAAKQQNARLKEAAENLSTARDQAQRAGLMFPADADQQALFRQMKTAAESVGIGDLTLESVTPGPPAYGATDAVGGATPAANPDGEGAPQVGTIASHTLVVAAKVPTYEAARAFVGALEQIDRSFLVSTTRLTTEEGFRVEVTGLMFMLPAPIDPDAPAPDVEDLPGVPGGSSTGDEAKDRELDEALVKASD